MTGTADLCHVHILNEKSCLLNELAYLIGSMLIVL